MSMYWHFHRRAVRLAGVFALLLTHTAMAGVSQHDLSSAAQELRIRYKLPSISLALDTDEATLIKAVDGYADVEDRLIATPETQYSVASLAKPMTAIALLRLADLQRISLDERVNKYIADPAYANQFTVRELASHLTGIPHETPERQRLEFGAVRDLASPHDSLQVFRNSALLFEPGSDVYYSSNGYILLSAVLDSVTEEGFIEFLKSDVWPALTMNETELDTHSPKATREAKYYSEFESLESFSPAQTLRNRSFLFGAGGFRSTAADMAKMARATYDERYLSQGALKAMYSPTSLRNGEVNPEDYSVGWRVGSLKLGEMQLLTLQHAGLMDDGATAYLFVIPACQTALAMATNSVPPKFWELYRSVEQIAAAAIDTAKCRKGR